MSTLRMKFTESAVKRRNAAFLKLPRAKQRVQIAEDVLLLLDAEKIAATRGTYFRALSTTVTHGTATVREIAAERTCEVCAIGSVFTAAMLCRGVDGDTLVDRNFTCMSRYQQTKHLEPYFTTRELNNLERMFENSSYDCDLSPDTAVRAAMEQLIRTRGKSLSVTRTQLRALAVQERERAL